MLKLLLQFWTCKIQKCLLISFFRIFQRQRFGCLLWHCNYVQLCLTNVGVLWQEEQQELKTWNYSISSCEVRSRWQDILILPYPNKHQRCWILSTNTQNKPTLCHNCFAITVLKADKLVKQCKWRRKKWYEKNSSEQLSVQNMLICFE